MAGAFRWCEASILDRIQSSAASTRSGASVTRQLVWPSGTDARKHGLHSSLSVTTRACGESGGVKARARRAEDRGGRAVERGGDVHESRVVGDDARGERHEVDRLVERGAAREVHAGPTARLPDLRGDGRVFRGAEEPYLESPRSASVARKRREVLRRPALGGTVFGTRREYRDRLVERQPECGERRGALRRVRPPAAARAAAAQRLARGLRERRVALGDAAAAPASSRRRAVVEQPAAHLAAIAGAHAGCPRATA